jgi:hypothetical protein
MKLENFTDLQTWAVEQWGDAELGDLDKKYKNKYSQLKFYEVSNFTLKFSYIICFTPDLSCFLQFDDTNLFGRAIAT